MEYLKKFKNICNTIGAVDEPVSYKDHLLYLFGGLGREYNSFVTFITSRANNPSIEEVHSLLLISEFRLDQQIPLAN